MNEQIRELAEQAGFDHMGIWKIIGIEEYHQKFAELIVEDCFRIALVEGRGYLDPIKLRAAMKKHFGVEQ
jgi:hypothetical protein